MPHHESLYLVVHHPQANQIYANQWSKGNNNILEAVSTPTVVKNACEEANNQNKKIYIYRCTHENIPASITCSVEVSEIKKIDRNSWLITFKNQIDKLNITPPRAAHTGESFFWM